MKNILRLFPSLTNLYKKKRYRKEAQNASVCKCFNTYY